MGYRFRRIRGFRPAVTVANAPQKPQEARTERYTPIPAHLEIDDDVLRDQFGAQVREVSAIPFGHIIQDLSAMLAPSGADVVNELFG
jgi:hypothetical protein